MTGGWVEVLLGPVRAAPSGTPDCWTAVRINGLSCVDANGDPHIIDR